MRDLLPSSDCLDYANHWRSSHAEPPNHSDRKSCSTRREISSLVYSHPFSERIGHNFPHGHRNCLCYHNSESTLRDSRQGAGFAEFRYGAKIHPWSVCTSTLTAVPSGQTRIFIRPGTISAIPWFFGSSDSLDYANRGRSPHAEPPSHSDRKLCSTRREISSPAKELDITFRMGIRIAYVTTIRNRHSETVDRELVSRNSIPGPKFAPGASDSLDYANRWRSQYAEPPSHNDRKSSKLPARPQFRISTSTRSVKSRIRRFPVRRPNSSPGARSRAADAIAYGHPFAQTGITFRSFGIGTSRRSTGRWFRRITFRGQNSLSERVY
ncbi:hypothetical protein Taro_043499 [Colocasia esculenta]|uniref:Uncharacterized protein n=1 Tax=Colocasia esculenta TaxID=4460 RepID=A0A843X0U0_COLES|nr:hypothetical protein [Colocasia esculenta]